VSDEELLLVEVLAPVRSSHYEAPIAGAQVDGYELLAPWQRPITHAPDKERPVAFHHD
jgi:hypothetical protein